VFQALKLYLQGLISFSEEEWLKLIAAIEVRKLSKQDLFLQPEETCKYIAFINRGALRTCYNKNGEEVTFYFFFENTFVGDYESFLTQKPVGFAIEAIEDCELLLFSYPKAQQLFNELQEGQKLARLIAEDLYISLRQRAFSLLLETPEQRYVKLLKENSPILSRVNQYYIASYIGVKPQSLSRIRRRLAGLH
jgi:CRP-like cAMP-binding protein